MRVVPLEQPLARIGAIAHRHLAKRPHCPLDLAIASLPDRRPRFVLLLERRDASFQVVARNAARAVTLHEHEAAVSRTDGGITHAAGIGTFGEKAIRPDLLRERLLA